MLLQQNIMDSSVNDFDSIVGMEASDMQIFMNLIMSFLRYNSRIYLKCEILFRADVQKCNNNGT